MLSRQPVLGLLPGRPQPEHRKRATGGALGTLGKAPPSPLPAEPEMPALNIHSSGLSVSLLGSSFKIQMLLWRGRATCGSESNVLELSEGNGSHALEREGATRCSCHPSHAGSLLHSCASLPPVWGPSVLGRGCWDGMGSWFLFWETKEEIHSKEPSATAEALVSPLGPGSWGRVHLELSFSEAKTARISLALSWGAASASR